MTVSCLSPLGVVKNTLHIIMYIEFFLKSAPSMPKKRKMGVNSIFVKQYFSKKIVEKNPPMGGF
jgi:hypothetical protein